MIREAPSAHYVLDSTEYPVELTADNETTEIIVKVNDGEAVFNTFPHYPVEIKKVDENGEGLAGALIEFKDAEENVVYMAFTAPFVITA